LKIFLVLREKLLFYRWCGLLGLKHAEAVIEADGNSILFDINQSLIDKGLNYLNELYPKAIIDDMLLI